MNDLAAAARRKVAALQAELASARQSERESIEWCASQKQPLGNGYWEARHDLELRLKAARALAEALQ